MEGIGAVPLQDDFPGGFSGNFSSAGNLSRFGRIKSPGKTCGRQCHLFGSASDLLDALPAVFAIFQCGCPLRTASELPGTVARILGPGRESLNQHPLEQRNLSALPRVAQRPCGQQNNLLQQRAIIIAHSGPMQRSLQCGGLCQESDGFSAISFVIEQTGHRIFFDQVFGARGPSISNSRLCIKGRGPRDFIQSIITAKPSSSFTFGW